MLFSTKRSTWGAMCVNNFVLFSLAVLSAALLSACCDDDESGLDTVKVDPGLVSAVGGDSVTITGSGFGTNPALFAVTISDLAATVLAVTQGELVIQTPYNVPVGTYTIKIVMGGTEIPSAKQIKVNNPWTIVDPDPVTFLPGRNQPIMMIIDEVPYFGLGNNASAVGIVDIWKRSITGTWSQVADYPGLFPIGCFSFSVGSKGYVGQGGNFGGSQQATDLWAYDPSVNTWQQKQDPPFLPRFFPVTMAISGTVFMGPGSVQDRTVWKYNATEDSWSSVSSYPGVCTGSYQSFFIKDKGYLCDGKELWEYNPATDSWSRKADLPGLAQYSATVALHNSAYFFCGINNGVLVKEAWQYLPESNSWIRRPDLPAGIEGVNYGRAFEVGKKMYIMSGYNSQFFQKILKYDPKPE